LRDNKLIVANCGDSRAVLASRGKQGGKESFMAHDLTVDQNPDSPGEQERIEQAGGFVSPAPEPGLSARVWVDKKHTQIGLAMSRSIGDHAVKPLGVIAEPVVTQHELSEQDEFFIIATDGVWEFIESQEAVDLVAEHLAKGEGSSKACQALIEAAAERWHEQEGFYRDDITALVIRLKELWKNE
jgi:protein phosphatase 2C family protein 2/3